MNGRGCTGETGQIKGGAVFQNASQFMEETLCSIL